MRLFDTAAMLEYKASRTVRFLGSLLGIIIACNSPMFARDASAFAFIGDRRGPNTNPAPGRPLEVPFPLHWDDRTLVEAGTGACPASRVFDCRILTISYNTTVGLAVPVADRPALDRAVTTWDNRTPVAAGNLVQRAGAFPPGPGGVPTPIRVLGGLSYDLESILLHELGHAFGLGHPNLADRTAGGFPANVIAAQRLHRFTGSTAGGNGVFQLLPVDAVRGNRDDFRGDDGSLHLVDADNNPFNARIGPTDMRTFSLDGPFPLPPPPATTAYAQASTREVAGAGPVATGFAAIANLEAVMVQGVRSLEEQRTLSWDDEFGLRYLESGPNQLSAAGFLLDNYVFDFLYLPGGTANAGGVVPQNVDVLVSNVPAPGAVALTSLSTRQPFFARPAFNNAIIEYSIDWENLLILVQTDIWLTGPLESESSRIAFVDIIVWDEPRQLIDIPTPAPLALLAAALVTGRLRARRNLR